MNQITASLVLATMFLTGGCEADSLSQKATFPSFKPSRVTNEAKTAKKEAIFVLGGAAERERFAASFARSHPMLPIWVSSGSPSGYARRIFARAGINSSRVHLDYEAVDTVTNFTSLVDRLKAEGIDSVYLITSDNHMRRARVVGEIVFGSRGIKLKPVPVLSRRPLEPTEKCLRDGVRAILWVNAGQDAKITENSRQNYTKLLNACKK